LNRLLLSFVRSSQPRLPTIGSQSVSSVPDEK
jgi:hypothetical protein